METDILDMSIRHHGELIDVLVEFTADGPDDAGVCYIDRIVEVEQGQFIDPKSLDRLTIGHVTEVCWRKFCDDRDRHEAYLRAVNDRR